MNQVCFGIFVGPLLFCLMKVEGDEARHTCLISKQGWQEDISFHKQVEEGACALGSNIHIAIT